MSFKTDLIGWEKEDEYWTTNNIIGASCFTLLGIITLVILVIPSLRDGLFMLTFLFPITIILVLHFTKFTTYNRPNRKVGKAEIGDFGIRVNEEVYNFDQISDLKLNIDDYQGKPISRDKYDFRGVFSQGLDNQIEFNTKAGQNVIIQFKLRDKNQKYELKDFYISAVVNKLLPIVKAHKLIGLKNYKQIQEFKTKHGIKH